MAKSYWSHALLYSSLAAALAGCGTVPENSAPLGSPVADIPATPPKSNLESALRLEPASRSGNPDTYVVFGRRYRVQETSEGYRERGVASWYGKGFHGRKTSSGPLYNMFDLTAAHKSLPIPTYVRVTNLENGRNVVVKVNDRGPFVGQRIIDLSYAAADRLAMLGKGTAQVEVTALEPYQLLPKLAARRADARRQLAGQPSKSASDGPATPRSAREEPKAPDSAALSVVASARAEPPPASPPLPLTFASVPTEPSKRSIAEPARSVTPPRGAAPPMVRVEPVPPAMSEPPRSELIAVRAGPPGPVASPPQTLAGDDASAGSSRASEQAHVPQAPVLDVPAPRLMASGEAPASVRRDPSEKAGARRAKADRSSPSRDGGQPSRESRKTAGPIQRADVRPSSRQAAASKAALVRLAGVKLNRSRNFSD
ncbi:MAG TPA: hypothetical protein DEP36_13690 [Gammaproteobacteria bacterium]|nr:hypothetical protein [Candidatus Competibacteraceae bacterium]HCB14601.1 hypothetical protein [Gammaproteobacteria bacterium]HUM94928.1 septal ring lytic transglycosylase RlpA family protein [Candidatus Competibacter sp.]